MVEQRPNALDVIFRALADPTRREMLRLLADRTHRITDLAAPFSISLAAASKHIKVLEHAGLVRREKRGRTHLCRLDPAPLAYTHNWFRRYERFWSERLDALERELKGDRK